MSTASENQILSLDIYISYSQIAAFLSSVENPFNDWSAQHVTQGFAWRPGSVSFKTLDEEGNMDVYIEVNNAITLRKDARRAIRVPFRVSTGEEVEIASITESHSIRLPGGNYSLVYQTGRTETGKMWCIFTFCTDYDVNASILKADDEINPLVPLLMSAQPA